MVILGWCVYVGAASAQLSIKGFSLGQDLDEAAASAQMRCVPIKRSSRRLCLNPAKQLPENISTIAGVEAQKVYLAGGPDNKVGRIHFGFRSDDFVQVRDALIAKYPSIKCSDSVVQNRMGASFDQTFCMGEVDGVELIIQRREGDVTVGGLSATSASYLAVEQKDEDARAAKAKGDF
ncbi:MAG: hypothetical protein AB7I35_01435 [Ramlibacter sp.]